MRKEFLLFLSTFTLIYSSLHLYVLGRIFVWSQEPFSWYFGVIISLLVLSYPAAFMLAQRIKNKLTMTFYTLASIWMGVIGITLVIVLIGEILSFFLHTRFVFNTVLITSALLSVYALINALFIRKRNYTITGAVKKPLTLALITDAHLGPLHGKYYLERLVKIINKQKPDALLLPGDLIDGPGALPTDLLSPLQKLDIPIFHSWGNHEHYVGEKTVTRLLKNTKVKSLRNEQFNWNNLTIIGIDDSESKNQVQQQLKKLKPKGYSILLYHRPEGLESAAKKNIGLMVCGHTHAGQILAFMPFVKARFPRMRGWFTQKNTKMFVSTGAGTWGPPMRLGSSSEIIFIRIEPEK